MRPQLLSICQETIVDLSEAAHLLGTTMPTVALWATSGCRGHVLEVEWDRDRSDYVTSEEAIARFLEECDWTTS